MGEEEVKLNLDADVQNQFSSSNVRAGILKLRVMINVGGLMLPAEFTVTTNTNRTRGVHMSRLVEAVNLNSTGRHLEDSLKLIAQEVEKTQSGAEVACSLEYPFRDIFVKVRVGLMNSKYMYMVTVPGITACPCSKEVAGIGHMQRAWLTIGVCGSKYMDLEETALKMLDCFSATTTEFMKRPDEGLKVLDSQGNPKFVEDVVRDAAKRFPEAFFIRARSEESIHMHDAVAYLFPKKRVRALSEASQWLLRSYDV
ncbi:MAG: GTP cyclohydrolase I FolE2 [Nitrososphaerota archaeon]|nr:GTP cyclohydrolase I FolE2 [Nitrososphaerota archaeon]